MFDERSFSDRYDLYRSTVAFAESGTGEQTITLPDNATDTDQPCLAFPAGRQPFGIGLAGLDIDFDMVMLVPMGVELRPSSKGQQPDVVLLKAKYYVVQKVWVAAGRGIYQVALLAERR